MSDDIEQLIKTVLPRNTVVIFQTDNQKAVQGLGALEEVFKRYGITAISCPKNVKIVVIPAGTKPEDVVAVSKQH